MVMFVAIRNVMLMCSIGGHVNVATAVVEVDDTSSTS